MADNNNEDNKKFAFFRSPNHGMSVIVGELDPTKGEVAHPAETFVPYFIEEKGIEGKRKVGFLKTNNPVAIQKLRDSYEAQEINEKTFDEFTEEKFDGAGVQIGGFRAPY